MTNIDIAVPIPTFRLTLPKLARPKIGIGAALQTICMDIGQAAVMAYVAPFVNARLQPPAVLETDLHGRDPSW